MLIHQAPKWRFSETCSLEATHSTLCLQALHEVDHGLISQLLVDSEENLRVPTEKMQAPSLYNWSSDWGFWISSSTYKYRNEEFKRQFSHIPDLESLVVGKRRSIHEMDRLY
uniref:Uncharacterized protein n=1 Tax=Varanus komodoensis TaxID=61221 RepID=A0A8D2LTR5_VARKO